MLFVFGVLLSSYSTYYSSTTEVESAIKSQMTQIAESLSTMLASWIERNKIDIQRWSRFDIICDAIPESFLGKAARKAAKPMLARLRDEYGFYEALYLCDIDGDVIVSSGDGSIFSSNMSQEAFFLSASLGHIFVSDIFAGIKGKPTLVIAAPVWSGERIRGVFASSIDLTYFSSQYVDPIKLSKTGYAYILRSDGLVIAHPDTTKVMKADFSDFPQGKKILKMKSGVMRYDYEGVNFIGAFKEERLTGLIIGINAPVDEIFAPSDRVRDIVIFITIVISFLIASTVALIVTGFVTKPINQFKKTMEAVAAGDLNRTISLKSTSEFTSMAKSFNKMALSLKDNKEELRRTYERLAQKERMAAMGELTARIAHEIKNPLGIIKGSAQILVDEEAEQETKKEVAHYIIEEVNNLAVRTQELLTYAKPMPLNFEDVDLNALLSERIKFWESRRVELKQMEIMGEFASNLPMVRLDKSLIKQSVMNIIINASEAMPGGGHLKISTKLNGEDPRAWNLRGSQGAAPGNNLKCVVVEFEDNGSGIEPENLSKIFNPFFTTKAEGTGLGLSAVYRIMEQHHAGISVESRPGIGTRFIMTFPVS